MGRGNFEGEGATQGLSAVNCAEPDEPIVVDSCGPKEAQLQSFSPDGADVPTGEGTLASPGEWN